MIQLHAVCKTDLRLKDMKKLKVKAGKRATKRNHKPQAEGLRGSQTTWAARDREGHFIMMKGSQVQANVTTIHTQLTTESQHT